VHALPGCPPSPGVDPSSVVALAGIVVLVVGAPRPGSRCPSGAERPRPVAAVSPHATGPPVLIVKGFNSEWDGITDAWGPGHYRIRPFSYTGLDARGETPQYGRSATHQSVRDLALELRTQVNAFHAATGEPVSIVAESEGSVVALAYLAASPHAPVRNLVVLSPLLAPDGSSTRRSATPGGVSRRHRHRRARSGV